MKVNHTVQVIDADHIESGRHRQFPSPERDLYRTGCSTAVGTRFE
jgi:hypothetical protein